MDVKWVKIRSWHAVKRAAGDFAETRCGRLAWISGIVDDLPAEKSCESCLRIIARLQDA